jgi:hypothetical protein
VVAEEPESETEVAEDETAVDGFTEADDLPISLDG